MGIGTSRSHLTVEIPKIQLGGGVTYHPLPAQCHCHTRSTHAGTPLGVWISLRSCLAPTIALQDSFTTQKFQALHLSPPSTENLGQTLFFYHLHYSSSSFWVTQLDSGSMQPFRPAPFTQRCAVIFSQSWLFFFFDWCLNIGSQLCESKQGSNLQQPSCLNLPSSEITCVFHYVWLFMSFHGSVVQYFLITK